jgi:spore germination cell wall hydrolase CwlJ-like protein
MFSSIRSALLLVAALSATSVGPARAVPHLEPLLPVTGATAPRLVTPQPLMIEDREVQPEVQATPLDDEAAPGAINKPRGDLSSLVSQLRSSDAGSRELECLAVGIYFESKSEPLVGQLAVGKVIANRANSKGRFPPSYCGVLFQRSQFSFIRGRSLPSVPRSSRQWQTAVAVARIVDQGLQASSVEKALFFHAKRVSPGWRLKRIASVGNHIFYR